MKNLHRHFSPLQTPQTEAMPGRPEMVPNAAGGFGFAVDKWTQLDRFLILGTEGGTYYATEQKLTVENAKNVVECIQEDGIRVVSRIVDISDGGKAAKNDYALFALALATTFGKLETRQNAYDQLPAIARTGTHLFVLLNYIESMRGWGRGLRNAVARWYTEKDPLALTYQLTKYRQRYGFSHRDALRLSHPEPPTATHNELFKYAVKGLVNPAHLDKEVMDYLRAADWAMHYATRPEDLAALIGNHRLPREVVPTEMLKEPIVWRALLGPDAQQMPLTALVRNLGNLTKHDIIKPLNNLSAQVAQRLRNPAAIRKARVHPFSIMAAWMTYRSGSGYRGTGEWLPVGEVVAALEDAFYLAFENVEPTGKRIVYAIDYSGSMSSIFFGGNDVAGVPGLKPSMAAGAMSLILAATEPNHAIWAFDTDLYQLQITGQSRLSEAMEATKGRGGGTDASLPMKGALATGVHADAFVILTDNETWAGDRHPVQALNKYRQATGIPTKMVVVSMTAGTSSIGDPQDAGILDVVGMSTDTPRLISDFIRE